MKKIILFTFTLLIILGAYTCFPKHYFSSTVECVSEGRLTENGDPLNSDNQQILREEIRNSTPENFRYYFKTFVEEASKTYMITNFRNDSLCFDIKILVDKWDRLAGMRRTNGKGYPNELYNLKWEIKNRNGREEVVYLDMHKIID